MKQKVSYRYRTSGYCTKKGSGLALATVNTRRVLLVHAPQLSGGEIADDINTNTQIQAIYRTVPCWDGAREEKLECSMRFKWDFSVGDKSALWKCLRVVEPSLTNIHFIKIESWKNPQ